MIASVSDLRHPHPAQRGRGARRQSRGTTVGQGSWLTRQSPCACESHHGATRGGECGGSAGSAPPARALAPSARPGRSMQAGCQRGTVPSHAPCAPAPCAPCHPCAPSAHAVFGHMPSYTGFTPKLEIIFATSLRVAIKSMSPVSWGARARIRGIRVLWRGWLGRCHEGWLSLRHQCCTLVRF